jgi:hypothetical protein
MALRHLEKVKHLAVVVVSCRKLTAADLHCLLLDLGRS